MIFNANANYSHIFNTKGDCQMTVMPCRAYPENAPMTELRTGELFAVMALRFWAAAYKEP
jgi:hypothetical protein